MSKRISLICLCVSLILIAVSSASAKQVYKWVDKDGKVHYSDRPQDESAQAIEIKDKITPEQQLEAKRRAKELIRLQNRRANIEIENAQDAKREQQKSEKEAQELKRSCELAKQSIEDLKAQVRLFTRKDDGEVEWMNDEKRKSELAKVEKDFAQYCSSGY